VCGFVVTQLRSAASLHSLLPNAHRTQDRTRTERKAPHATRRYTQKATERLAKSRKYVFLIVTISSYDALLLSRTRRLYKIGIERHFLLTNSVIVRPKNDASFPPLNLVVKELLLGGIRDRNQTGSAQSLMMVVAAWLSGAGGSLMPGHRGEIFQLWFLLTVGGMRTCRASTGRTGGKCGRTGGRVRTRRAGTGGGIWLLVVWCVAIPQQLDVSVLDSEGGHILWRCVFFTRIAVYRLLAVVVCRPLARLNLFQMAKRIYS